MKKIFFAVAVSSLMIINQAQAGFMDLFDPSASRLKNYNAVVDKPLVDAFYTLSADGKTQGLTEALTKDGFAPESVAPSFITVKKTMYRVPNMGEMTGAMNNYNYDTPSDSLSVAYVAFAKSRGNIVKLYKPKMNGIINSMYKQPISHMERSAEWYDLDNALIEYAKSGAPVSFLVRAHQAQTSLGVTSYQYATIFFGKDNCRSFENRVNNADLQNYVMREMQ